MRTIKGILVPLVILISLANVQIYTSLQGTNFFYVGVELFSGDSASSANLPPSLVLERKPPGKRLVFDLTLFNVEKALARVRFQELRDSVDYFVVGITMETVYPQGAVQWPKHAWVREAAELAGVSDRLHIVNITFDEIMVPGWQKAFSQKDQKELNESYFRVKWFREALMRNKAILGFDELGALDDDLVYASDLDEIPFAGILKDVIETHDFDKDERIFSFQDMWRYDLDFTCNLGLGYSQYCGQLLPVKILRTFGWQSIRTPGACKSIGPYANCTNEIFAMKKKLCTSTCAWHLSWFGGYEAFANKSISIAEGRGAANIQMYKKFYSTREKTCNFTNFTFPFVPASTEPFVNSDDYMGLLFDGRRDVRN